MRWLRESLLAAAAKLCRSAKCRAPAEGDIQMLRAHWTIAVAVAALLAPQSTAQTYYPVRLKAGWETRLIELTPLPSEAAIRSEIKLDPATVYFAYDEFWLLAPFWTANGRYVIHVAADGEDGLKRGLYELKR